MTSVTKQFLLQAAQKEVALRTHVGRALDCYGDPVKLSWVLSTLIANAISFTPEGGSVEVSAGRDGESLRISVSDSGRGVPLELATSSSNNILNGSRKDLTTGPRDSALSLPKR